MPSSRLSSVQPPSIVARFHTAGELEHALMGSLRARRPFTHRIEAGRCARVPWAMGCRRGGRIALAGGIAAWRYVPRGVCRPDPSSGSGSARLTTPVRGRVWLQTAARLCSGRPSTAARSCGCTRSVRARGMRSRRPRLRRQLLVGRFPPDRVLQRREAEDRGRCHRTRRNHCRRWHPARRSLECERRAAFRRQGGHRPGRRRWIRPGPVTSLDQVPGDYQHGWPEFLPDGNHFLYVIRSRVRNARACITGRSNRRRSASGSCRRIRAWRTRRPATCCSCGTGHCAQSFRSAGCRSLGEPVTLRRRSRLIARATGVRRLAHEHPDLPRQRGLPSTRLVLFDRRGRSCAR